MEFAGVHRPGSETVSSQLSPHTSFCDRMLAADTGLLRVAWWFVFFFPGGVHFIFVSAYVPER